MKNAPVFVKIGFALAWLGLFFGFCGLSALMIPLAEFSSIGLGFLTLAFSLIMLLCSLATATFFIAFCAMIYEDVKKETV